MSTVVSLGSRLAYLRDHLTSWKEPAFQMDWASGKRSSGEGDDDDGARLERDAGEGRCSANRSGWLVVGPEVFFGFFEEECFWRLVFGGSGSEEEEEEGGGGEACLYCSWRRRECGVGTASAGRRASRRFSVRKNRV